MSKKRSWFSLIKRLLFLETHHHHQQQKQKIKRRRWMFGKLSKRTKTLPSITTPSPTQPQAKQIPEEQEEEQKHIKCDKQNNEDDVKHSLPCQIKLQETITNEVKLSLTNDEKQCCVEIFAAIKIQAIYRGYLARKALRALKGFVRLQAIIRGRAVRRQAMTTLKCLQSIAKIQSEVCARRCQMIRGKDGDLQLQLQLQDLRNESPKLQVYKQRRKDSELLTKEEQINLILRKKEALLRSKRDKAYSINHRHSADSEDGISQGRLRYWLEHYVSEDGPKKDDKNGGQQRLRNIDGLNIFDIAPIPRRSYHKHKKQNSYGEDYLHSNSPINLPTYMASTESAKAKTRSLSSSPRLRPLHIDPYSDNDNSPYKHKLSPMSSINSEATCSGYSKVSNKSSTFSSSQQKSPSFKGVSGPIRSNKSLK